MHIPETFKAQADEITCRNPESHFFPLSHVVALLFLGGILEVFHLVPCWPLLQGGDWVLEDEVHWSTHCKELTPLQTDPIPRSLARAAPIVRNRTELKCDCPSFLDTPSSLCYPSPHLELNPLSDADLGTAYGSEIRCILGSALRF